MQQQQTLVSAVICLRQYNRMTASITLSGGSAPPLWFFYYYSQIIYSFEECKHLDHRDVLSPSLSFPSRALCQPPAPPSFRIYMSRRKVLSME